MIRPGIRTGKGIIPLGLQRNDGDSFPAPVGGWNARDSVTDMRPGDAVILDNWFPRTSDVRVRNGTSEHATGLGAAVESLMTWNGPASSKMFGAASTNIYDVTNAGAVGAAAVSSMSNARWQHVNYANSAGAFLYIVNGADAPRYYDGSSWTVPTITGSGLTATNLIHLTVFKRALFFCEANKLGFWYFPVETIAGAISYFDLGPVCELGGSLKAIGTWTRDGGSGIDDFLVCVTTNGEAIIFQGTDPSDSTLWSHVGTFRIGAPIGRRCLTKLGTDLVVITVDGFAPLSKFLIGGRLSKKSAISDKINGAVQSSVKAYGSVFGWQPFQYPRGNMMIFNVPIIAGTTFHQYVANTTTGSWCRFKAMDANCWGLLNDLAYYGGNGKVYLSDTGTADVSANIATDAQTAFNYFKKRGVQKQFNMVRPIFVTDGDITIAMEMMVDFEEKIPTATPTFSISAGAEWDTATWDVSEWSDFERILKGWHDVAGLGYAGAVRLLTTSNGGNIRWQSTDVLWEPARGLI